VISELLEMPSQYLPHSLASNRQHFEINECLKDNRENYYNTAIKPAVTHACL